MTAEERATSRYEIHVQGLLGPLLLSTLPHTASTRIQRHSVLITRSSNGPDVVELMQMIIGSGLEVDSIRAIAHDSPADSAA
jgi:hypothetical protein